MRGTDIGLILFLFGFVWRRLVVPWAREDQFGVVLCVSVSVCVLDQASPSRRFVKMLGMCDVDWLWGGRFGIDDFNAI